MRSLSLLLCNVFAEVVSVDIQSFKGLRHYVNQDFLEYADVNTVDKKEKLAARNKNVNIKTLDTTIAKIDEQIKKVKVAVKSKNYDDPDRWAYLIDKEKDMEAFFVNVGNEGWVDFYREGKNIWVRCKQDSGFWLFYEEGPFFEQLVGDSYLVVQNSNQGYKAYSNSGNKSSKMKTTDNYYRQQKVFFDRMWDRRANLFQRRNLQ